MKPVFGLAHLLLVSSDTSFDSSPDKGVVTMKFRCVASDVQSIRLKVQQPAP